MTILCFMLMGVAQAEVEKLLCEYRDNPLGIDSTAPRLSWRMKSADRGQRQTAYQILVATSPELLQREEGDLWESGKVISDQSLHVRYAGKPLAPRQTCYWKVRTWDMDGKPGNFSEIATWEIGLPGSADWSGAQWIQLPKDTRSSPLSKRGIQTQTMPKPRLGETFPAPLFRKEFIVRPGISRARAYVCGIGYNEVSINGQRSGDAVLDPGQTTFDQRAYYVTHDITPMLKTGVNAVGIALGNGFFGQNQAFNASGLGYGPPTLIARIVVDYADGSSQSIATDDTWKAETGPIVYDNVYGGESYDARLEKHGWDSPGYNAASWLPATKAVAPSPRLQAQMIPPIRCMETFPNPKVIAGKNGKWIFDLGRNIAGWAKIRIKAPAGTQLKMTFSEILTPDGNALEMVTTGVFATGLPQMDIYVCKGGELETWSPRFTYHGFRYVEVEGLTSKPAPDFLEGVLVHTDVPKRGSFTSSDELLNRIHRTSLHTIEDNIHSVPEDCPHREKCAWLGDAHAVGEATIFNYDMAQFWTKFVDDIETVLGRGGVTYWGAPATPGIPCNIAVGKRLCQESRPDWGSAYVMLPAYLYTYYGDTDVFTRHYEHLKRWIDYVKSLREDGIVVRGYGDWCPPGGNPKMECPPPLTSTAYFHATLVIMEDFAGQLGKSADAAVYKQLAEETKAAFVSKFFDERTGSYGSQTADAVALRFGITPKGQQAKVAAALRAGVMDQHGGHAFVGIHGGRPLYTELCENGHEDAAFTALLKETFPSHGYSLNHGLTTWPEVPLEDVPGKPIAHHSLNHPMQSGFAAFFHEGIGGINPAAPGFKRITLNPHGYTQLASASAEHECLYGLIRSNWKCDGKTFNWEISVPPNTSATAWVPAKSATSVLESEIPVAKAEGVKFLYMKGDRAVFTVESGTFRFTSKL